MPTPDQDEARRDGAPQDETHRHELTWRGLALGAAITVIFMAANLYMGLKTGVTFASSIPAAVISMGVLRLLGGGNILENNMVQTQASAAGTLCNVILVLPALVIVGHWRGFPFVETTSLCLLGGLLGVLFSIPLRRAMVVESDLPFPEGVAAAEVLRAGNGDAAARGGLRDLAEGAGAAAGFALLAGVRLLGDGVTAVATAGHAVFRVGAGFSLALVGVGYLVGIGACLALLIGVAAAWGIAVPLLTAFADPRAGTGVPLAMTLWSSQVRLIGAGIIAVAGVWVVGSLFRPMLRSVGHAFAVAGAKQDGEVLPRQERDLPIGWVTVAAGGLALPLGVLIAAFSAADGRGLGFGLQLGFVVAATVFTVVFGFLMATACGYMAGLLGSSSSPISGIGILGTIVISLLLSRLPVGAEAARGLMATALFVTAVVVTMCSIANDNLQDLKTGQLVDATPWRQQVVLLVGVGVGAMVIAPLLELLYQAYGFAGSLPRAGMDAGAAMAAPQASLVATIAQGIFGHTLPWTMMLIGIGAGVCFIGLEEWLRPRGLQIPTLTVGLGMYLPPQVAITIALGGVIGWVAERRIRRQGEGETVEAARERLRRRGVLLSSGFLVGESVAGMGLAVVEAVRGHPPALAGAGFDGAARWLGGAIFLAVLVLFFRAVSRGKAEPADQGPGDAALRLLRGAGAD